MVDLLGYNGGREERPWEVEAALRSIVAFLLPEAVRGSTGGVELEPV